MLIVEGFWDVLRLRELGIAGVGIMSNHITDEQLACVVEMARATTTGRVGIMFDADEKGDEGAKDALWKQSELGLPTRLVWSRRMFDAEFNGKEPESISQDDLTAIAMYLG
ncbi:MAG: toprim domain-containing protein [Planctomycetota bacterium]|nr:toprim domain-containing protein [Planctomycetota bacterium]